MKNLIKIFSILLAGTAALLHFSCEREYPFPKAHKVTFVTFDGSGYGAIKFEDPLSTQIQLGIGLHKFGGTEFSKIEVFVIKNPENAELRKNVKLTEITRPLSSTPTNLTFTYQQLLDATQTPALNLGDQFTIYYNLYMPDGRVMYGWHERSGFNDKIIADIPGAVLKVQYTVVCGVDFNFFLGDWTIESAFIEDIYNATATEDPENPGKGLIFTVTDPGLDVGEPPFGYPLKMTVDLSAYTWNFPKQKVWDDLGHWGLPYTNFCFGAGAGGMNTCETPFTIRWNAASTVDQGGFGNHAVVFVKM